jgi:serine/threonine-protein kinase
VSDEDEIDSVLRGVAAAPPLGARAPSASLLGVRVGNYQLERLLGEGGMGAVYLGQHPLIGKQVAIKVLHNHLSQEEEVVARFFTEARAVNDIRHENIVDIIDFGHADKRAYILMELLSGESLRQRMDRGNLPHPEIIHVLSQAAGALAASHARSIIHRDLKPENIFVTARGHDPCFVKLLDFGIAKLTKDHSAWRTQTGALIGTPLYMSPEQCAGRRNIGEAADIYALGVVLFELLAGRVPFAGSTLAEVLRGHMIEPPPSLPPSPLSAIAMKCLAKEPSARYSSMTRLRAELEAASATRSATPTVLTAAPSRGREIWLAAGITAAIAAGVALAGLVRSRAPAVNAPPPVVIAPSPLAAPTPRVAPPAASSPSAAPLPEARPKKKHHPKAAPEKPAEVPANGPLDDKLL